MTKQSKITATEARFALETLTLSAMNPRQTVPDDDVEALAASIWAAGLIQPIAGYSGKEGSVEIVAGGRRLRALQLLATQHPDMADTRPELANPSVMLAPDVETAELWANTENVARRDLHPAEEIRAYGKMEAKGATPTVIACAFAVTEQHVYRRLALSHLAEPILDALAAGELSLTQASAFTISDDAKQSVSVLEQVRGEDYSPHRIKDMLKPSSIRSSDRRAIFVGEAAYKAEGGKIGGDLFADQQFFDNPDILQTVFEDKAVAEAEAIREAEGWKWVKVITETPHVGWHEIQDTKCERVYAEQGELTEDEAARYDELAELAEGEVLDEAGHAELEILQAIFDGDYTEDQKAHAGLLIYVNQTGELSREAGLILPEDKAEAITAGVLEKSAHSSANEGPKSPISAKLADDLSRVVRGARQHAALRDPDLLVDLLAYQLSHSLRWENPFGLSKSDVPNWPTTEDAGYALDTRLTENPPRDMWDSKDLAASFRAFRKKGAEHVRGELVRFLADQYKGGDDKLTAFMDKETGTDIRVVWTPTAANFFMRVSGPYMEGVWRDLLDLDEDHAAAKTFAKLKKAEKANCLEALFGDPAIRAAHSVTEAQEAKIAAWLPEGME